MFAVGQIVYSKSGHDKGRAFVVVNETQQDGAVYAFLVDGRLRLLEKPKKKKAMHIQVTKNVDENIAAKLNSGAHIMDSDIRKALEPYLSKDLRRF